MLQGKLVGDNNYEVVSMSCNNNSWLETDDEVLEFIYRRWTGTNAHWCTGNCYWFAQILLMRFPYLRLYYMPITGHFVAGTPSRYYDVNGLNRDKEKPILFEEIEKEDPVWAARLLRDCRD